MKNEDQEYMNLDFISEIHTPDDWKKNVYEHTTKLDNVKQYKRKWSPSIYKLSPMFIVIIIIFSMTTITVSAYATGGIEAFKNYIKQDQIIKTGHHNNIEQFDHLEGNDCGIVVEDEKINIEVVSSVSDGSSVIFMLKLTVKDKKVLKSMGIAYVNGLYQFTTENKMNQFDSDLFADGTSSHYYCVNSDKEHDLQKNQFMIVCHVITNGINSDQDYNVKLGEYTFPLNFTIEENTHLINIDKTLHAGDYEFYISCAYLSEMTLRIDIPGDFKTTMDRDRDSALLNSLKQMKIVMKDGTEMDSKTYKEMIGPTDENLSGYSIKFGFNAPVDVSQIDFVKVEDQVYMLNY